VADPVWRLFERAARLFPDVAVCIEWDNDVPAFDVMLDEMRRAEAIQAASPAEARSAP
jgi:uncharacterized protein (UPF0276 family)